MWLFILRFEEKRDSELVAVWALDINAIHRAATVKITPRKKLPDGKMVLDSAMLHVDFSRDDIFTKHVMPELKSFHRSLHMGEPDIENVVPILPSTQNERLSAQQGLFLCPSQVGPSLLEQLQKLMINTRREWIVKIIAPRSLREDALRKLFRMNIHPLSLFPGADGLGRFCKPRRNCLAGDFKHFYYCL